MREWASGFLVAAAAAGGTALVLALAMGAYRAVSEGGSDARRADRAQSRIFWSIGGGAVVLLALAAAWVLSARPRDLRAVSWVVPAARGEWIAIGGHARAHEAVFLENLETGDFVRGSQGRRVPVIAADGSRAAWGTSEAGLPEPSVAPRTVSLADSAHPTVSWGIKDLHEDPLLVFSADGRRLAVIAADRIVVSDAANGRTIAAARPEHPFWKDSRGFTCATFAGDDLLRVYAVRAAGPPPGQEIGIFAFDLRTRSLRRTGTAGPFSGVFPILASAARDRLLVRERPATVHLLDAATGATLRTIAGGGASARAAVFLSDGGIALFESENEEGRIVVLAPDGEERRRIPIGPAHRAYLLGESAAGALVIAAGSGEDFRERRGRVLSVDVAAGTTEMWAEGVLPASPYAATLSGDPGNGPAPGGLATRLFFTPAGELVELRGPHRLRRIHPGG